jgi:hypothetical protein
MNCVNCNELLPVEGYFCPACAKQTKCINCGAFILKDAKACIFCGEQIGRKAPSTPVINIVEFDETKNSRSFKAKFSDTVGQSISDSFGLLLSNKSIPRKTTTMLPVGGTIFPRSGNAETSFASQDAIIVEDQADNIEFKQLNIIFKNDGQKITLAETRLKAKSKLDYGKRLSILFLYYKSMYGVDKVPRPELTTICNSASVEDGNLRYWLANNSVIGITDDGLELKVPGRDEAKKFLAEIANPDIKDGWQIGSGTRGARKSSKDKKNLEKK